MSSESESSTQPTKTKRRRVARACDSCRLRKTKCDGDETHPCTYCVVTEIGCTFVGTALVRASRKGYIKIHETRLNKMEAYLKKLMTKEDFEREFGQGEDILRSTPGPGIGGEQPNVFSSTPSTARTPDEGISDLAEKMASVELMDDGPKFYFGRSSGASLVVATFEAKTHATGSVSEMRDSPAFSLDLDLPWEKTRGSDNFPPVYYFPPTDLLYELVELYFLHYHPYFSFLHKPTFMRQLSAGLHLVDIYFGANVLVVCALGARYSTDDRVFMEGYNSKTTCGWKWFGQLQLVRDATMIESVDIFGLQFCMLASLFLVGTNCPRSSWNMIGLGLRLAQDVGADRRWPGPPTLQTELRKRAWWALVVHDRLVACANGKPPAVKDEDFDADLPVDCDDEYWEHPDPELAFKQPSGKPSETAAFIQVIGLARLLGTTLRTLYCLDITRASPLAHTHEKNWRRNTLERLDSALNAWSHNLPHHLIWQQDRYTDLYFRQSAYVNALCYSLRITIHRPFIPMPGRAPQCLDIPSFAICTNAARSCIRLMDTYTRQTGLPCAWGIGDAMLSGILLMLSAYSAKRTEHTLTPRDKQDIEKVMGILGGCTDRWRIAHAGLECLHQITLAGEQPIQPTPGPRGQKRTRQSDVENVSRPDAHSVSPPLDWATVSQPHVDLGFLSQDMYSPINLSMDAGQLQHPSASTAFDHPVLPLQSTEDFPLWGSMLTGYYAPTSPEDWQSFLNTLAEFQDPTGPMGYVDPMAPPASEHSVAASQFHPQYEH